MLNNSPILIISDPIDLHTQAIKAVLENNHDISPSIFDINDFPITSKGSFFSDYNCEKATLNTLDSIIDLTSVKSIFWRRPSSSVLPNSFYGSDREFAQIECDHFIQGLLWNTSCFWVNPPLNELKASRKIVQLSMAKKLGLLIPRTIITNNPDEAKKFCSLSKNQVIFKRTGTGPGLATKTTIVSDETIEKLSTIKNTPTIFQEYVDALADLRVICVGNKFFAIEIDSQNGTYPEDCRFDLNVKHCEHKLPSAIQSAIANLMLELGLVYAAIDFRIGKDKQYYFLEVNPSGQYAYLEVKTGLPITDSLASLLVNRIYKPTNIKTKKFFFDTA